MNEITKETRREAYITRPSQKRYTEILTVLGDEEMTARQIAYRLGYTDLNAVKPRLTELTKKGAVEVVGKALDLTTGRKTAVYQKA